MLHWCTLLFEDVVCGISGWLGFKGCRLGLFQTDRIMYLCFFLPPKAPKAPQAFSVISLKWFSAKGPLSVDRFFSGAWRLTWRIEVTCAIGIEILSRWRRGLSTIPAEYSSAGTVLRNCSPLSSRNCTPGYVRPMDPQTG